MHNKSDSEVTDQNASCIWAGCDVAKDTFEVSLATSGVLKNFPVASFKRSPDGVRELLKWADKQLESSENNLRVVMEATGKYSVALTCWMVQERPSLEPAIINPLTAKSFIDSLGFRNKTDTTDARALACFGKQRQPVAYQLASEAYSRLRELVRLRQAIIQTRIQYELRLQETESSSPAYKVLKKIVKQQEKAEKDILVATKKLVADDADLRRDIELIDQIVGVGFITATTILGELGDLRRFATARQISSFAGVNPRRYESGTSVYKRTALSKKGSAYARAALYMASLSIVGGDSDLAKAYRRLLAAGKPKMSALGVVMRKLLVLMRAIIISGKPYEDGYVEKLAKAS